MEGVIIKEGSCYLTVVSIARMKFGLVSVVIVLAAVTAIAGHVLLGLILCIH